MSYSKTKRLDPLFLRASFTPVGRYGFPKLASVHSLPLKELKLLPFTDMQRSESASRCHWGVQGFSDVYHLESFFNTPKRTLATLSQYRFLIPPNCASCQNLPKWTFIDAIGKSRWLAAFWQSEGLTVIPSLSWDGADSFSYCFDGIAPGTIVSVSTKHIDQSKRESFLLGYFHMLSKIKPEKVLCVGVPFIEMTQNKTTALLAFSQVRSGRIR